MAAISKANKKLDELEVLVNATSSAMDFNWCEYAVGWREEVLVAEDEAKIKEFIGYLNQVDVKRKQLMEKLKMRVKDQK